MKTIGLLLALSLFAGCKKGGSAASQCSDAVGKGVDKMIAMRKQKLDEQGSNLPPERQLAEDFANGVLALLFPHFGHGAAGHNGGPDR